VKIFGEVVPFPEFKRDLKKLAKRFKTLEDDLNTFVETQLNLYHKLEIDNKGIVQLTDLEIENVSIYKARKFACRSLKGRGVQSGIRIIYAYFEEKDKIELIEVYYKGDKGSEDRQRIFRHYK